MDDGVVSCALDTLREDIISSLLKQGFSLEGEKLCPPNFSSKEEIRQFYRDARQRKLERNRKWLSGEEDKLIRHFANGSEIEPEKIRPTLELIDTERKAKIFRYASLLWSVPVSDRCGRRARFLVWDESNGKLIGIFAIGDSIFNLGPRDKWIGWDKEEKTERLRYVMDIYVLGAVPPYSFLLGGKLVALLAASDETRETIRRKYGSHLALLTTTSALGRSSIYNRISVNGRKVYISVGYTKGYGLPLFPEELLEIIREVGRGDGPQCVYEGGSCWTLGVLKRGFRKLGLSSRPLRHGIRREVFVVPLAENAREFLRGVAPAPMYHNMPAEMLFGYFKERWLMPRAERDKRYRDFDRESLRLTKYLT